MYRQATRARTQVRPSSPAAAAASRSSVQEVAELVGGIPTLVIGALAILAGVVYFWAPWNTPIPQGSCVIAVDYQGSAAPMIDSYKQWAKEELNACADDGHADIAVIPITSATEADYTSEVVRLNFSSHDLDIGNSGDRTRLVQHQVDDAADQTFESWTAHPANFKGGTDIIGAPVVARELLTGDGTKTLIILSDAMENHDYKFHKGSLDAEAISGMLKDLGAAGRIPDLSGVEVKMYGVNAGTLSTDIPRERLNEVKMFWTRYFRAANADLIAYAKQPVR